MTNINIKAVDRHAFLHIVLGYIGTGKTSVIKKFVLNELKNGGRALIITPDDEEWLTVPEVNERFPERIANYVGARRIIYDEPGTAAERKAGGLNSVELAEKHFQDGLLVLDDCMAYIDFQNNKTIRRLCMRRRQNRRDLIIAAHGFTDVPKLFFKYYSKIILYYTQDDIEERKGPLRSRYNHVVEVSNRVNEKSIKEPHYYEIIDNKI